MTYGLLIKTDYHAQDRANAAMRLQEAPTLLRLPITVSLPLEARTASCPSSNFLPGVNRIADKELQPPTFLKIPLMPQSK